MLPRHQPRLRMPEERFYRQLETVWRAQYGEAARLDWLEAGGRRWRMARRPSLDQPGAVVFHLVTVLEGRAHHLLAYAPLQARDLPRPVRELLDAPANAAADVPANAAANVNAAAARGAPASAVPAVVEAAPQAAHAGASKRGRWVRQTVVRVLPDPAALEDAARREARALDGDGGVTGLALQGDEHGLTASLEGFVWAPGAHGKAVRRPFTHRWELGWTAPPQVWHDEAYAAIALSAGAFSDEAGLGIGLRYLCAGPERLREALAGLERAPGDGGERPGAEVGSCRAAGLSQAEVSAGAGRVSRPVLIQPPLAPPVLADEQGLLVLTLRPLVQSGRPGRALLGAAAVHYVYTWER